MEDGAVGREGLRGRDGCMDYSRLAGRRVLNGRPRGRKQWYGPGWKEEMIGVVII